MENWNDNYISWKPVTETTNGDSDDKAADDNPHHDDTPFLATSLVPRPTAWIAVYPAINGDTIKSESDGSVDANNVQPLVALVEGYCGASDRPPSLMLGSDSLPSAILHGLRQNRVCTLSVATEREKNVVKYMVASTGEKSGPAKTFHDAKLKPCPPPIVLSSLSCPNDWRRPPAVESSPVHMHCRLILDEPLHTDDGDSTQQTGAPSMLLLQIDTYVIKGEILRAQSCLYPGQTTTHGNPDVRTITAKIDCLLLRPLASLGNGKCGSVECIYHMRRPLPLPNGRKLALRNKNIAQESSDFENDLNESTCNNTSWENSSLWEIDQLIPVDSIDSESFSKRGDGESISYTYRLDLCCPLGYNPMKQVVCPRFIGWISTYEPNSLRNANSPADLIHHISPYSFFIDVARGSRPMVAFAACPRSDEFAESDDDESNPMIDQCNGVDDRKDAWRDAEDTGVFCVNLVSAELAWAMSASAAPLGKGLSEFRLMESDPSCTKISRTQYYERIFPTSMPAPTIDAPFVSQSPMFMECRFVKTGKRLHGRY